ncbi:MAG: hypothetical protein KDD47_19175, partial [Acidobacteria bacterium]|nr:hypothetical protein [Acidobacteriota bacterium]
FNIWYLMRASRRVRRRLAWLVEFLRIFYSPPTLLAQARRHLDRSFQMPDALRQAELGFALAEADEYPPLRGAPETSYLSSTLAEPSIRSDSVSYSHTLACMLVRNGKWEEALPPARHFLGTGSEEFHEKIWADIVLFFREAVGAGKASEAGRLVDELNLGDRWRPLREALEAIAVGRRSYLERVAPEVREPAEELLEQLVGADWEGDAPRKKAGRQRRQPRRDPDRKES